MRGTLGEGERVGNAGLSEDTLAGTVGLRTVEFALERGAAAVTSMSEKLAEFNGVGDVGFDRLDVVSNGIAFCKIEVSFQIRS